MKTLALFVLSVFLLSLVATAYAHQEDRGKHLKERLDNAKDRLKDKVTDAKKLENLGEHELMALEKVDRKFKDKLDKLDKTGLEKIAKLPPGLAKMALEDPKFEALLERWKVKQVAKDEMSKAFERRHIADSRGDALKVVEQKLEKTKKEMKEKRDDFKRTKNVTEAKSYLTKVLDSLIEKVNKLKERVGASDDLSEEKAKEVLDDLNSRLAKLNEWKTKIEAATKEDLKKLVKEVKDYWRHLDHVLKLHGWRVAVEHFGGILRQAEHLDNKLNKWLAFAENNNATIPNKDARVAEFESKLADARKSHELLVSDFKKLKELVQNKTENVAEADAAARKALVDSLHNNLKAGKNSLREARDILVSLVKDVVKEVKAKNPETESGKPVDVKEENLLDPTKAVEGVELEEGPTGIEVVQEEAEEL